MPVSISKVTFDHYEPGAAVGTATPRVSWRFGGDSSNWTQAEYTLTIKRSDSSNEFKVTSDESVLVPWPDKPLSSREKATVTVLARGTDGSEATGKAEVEAALLEPSDWTAQSITRQPVAEEVDAPKRPFLVQRKFKLDAVPKDARLYITAEGVYEASVNGKLASDHVLAPGWQAYSYRLAYQVLDVTELLQAGENTISAWVGEGWWVGRLGFHEGARNIWGEKPSLIAQLEGDGKLIVQTDKEWEWANGSLLRSEIYDGEEVDTTVEVGKWAPVDVHDRPKTKLVAPQAPPVRRTDLIPAKEIIKTPAGKTVIDFGQNLVGWIRWNKQVDGKGTVTIRHAEVMEHGELGTRPLRFAKATDTVVLGGKTAGFEPKFTFHGFR